MAVLGMGSGVPRLMPVGAVSREVLEEGDLSECAGTAAGPRPGAHPRGTVGAAEPAREYHYIQGELLGLGCRVGRNHAPDPARRRTRTRAAAHITHLAAVPLLCSSPA